MPELQVAETLIELEGKKKTPAEIAEEKKLQKQQEKQAKKQREYAMSMISRAEAHQTAQQYAMQESGKMLEFMREPLRVNLIQTLAVVKLLTAKGIISDTEEFQTYIDQVVEELDRVKAEEEANAQEGNIQVIDQASEYPEEISSPSEETEEQQS